MLMRTLIVLVMALPAAADVHVWSVFLGANQGQIIVKDVKVDPSGYIYIAGWTSASDFPTTPGAFQTVYGGGSGCGAFPRPCPDAFIAKLEPNGQKFVWATFLGGTGDDRALALDIDAAGQVYVTGPTGSPNFPGTTAPPNVTTPNVFVAKLGNDGATLKYSLVFKAAYASDLAIDASGRAHVVGTADPVNTVATPGAFRTVGSGGEGYLARVNAEGTALEYLTFLGGSGDERVTGVALNPAGEIHVFGTTDSPDFPGTQQGFQRSLGGGDSDVFIAKLNITGTALLWATYLGGRGWDQSYGSIALDGAGAVYVSGQTVSADFPVTASAFPKERDIFVSKISPDGARLVYSRSLGIKLNELSPPQAMTVDATGQVHVAGTTTSRDLATTYGAIAGVNYSLATAFSSGTAGFLIKLNAAGSEALYASYLGGTGQLVDPCLAVDAQGSVYLFGAGTGDFPAPGSDSKVASDLNGNALPIQAVGAKLDLTFRPPVWLAAVVNAASYAPRSLNPGEIISIFGHNLGPAAPIFAQPVDGRMPVRLGETEVLIDGVAAPLLYVSSGQINAIVPFGADDLVDVSVSTAGQTSNAVRLRTTPVRIDVFTLDASGQGQAVVLNQDNTINSASNPAARGSTVQMWVTGAGPTNPLPLDGAIARIDDRSPLVHEVSVIVGSAEATRAVYAGAAPGMVTGVAQINFRIPDNAPVGPAVRIWFPVDQMTLDYTLQRVTITIE